MSSTGKKDFTTNGETPVESLSQRQNARRKTLKSVALGGGVVALPTEWKKPIIESVLLPVHAQTSATTTAAPTTTAASTTTVAPATTSAPATTAAPTTTPEPTTTTAPTTTPVPTTTCVPGSLSFTFTTMTQIVFSVQQSVDYQFVVTNSGPGEITSFSITTSDLGSFGGGPLAPGQSETIDTARSFTWSLGQDIVVDATLTGEDSCGNQFSDTQTVTLPTIGANMAIYASQDSVNPGDEIQVKLVSRLYAAAAEDAQWINMKYRCNLLNNQWRSGGPNDQLWADPSDDFINQKPGAADYALDLGEAKDFGDRPDWIHEFTYKVPEDITKDLVIEAEDAGLAKIYQNGKWSSEVPLENGYDRVVLKLNN